MYTFTRRILPFIIAMPTKLSRTLVLFFLFSLLPFSSTSCHLVSITETSSTDNGDGTYTYTFDVCVGTEDTYGFYLSFTGANLISYPASVTSTSLGTTMFPSVPPVSGSGTIEYGDWDNGLAPLFSGFSNDCFSMTFVFDGPITDADIDGTQPFYAFGPCAGTTPTTSCFAATYSVQINTDDYGGETSWEITDQITGAVVASGSGYASNSTNTIDVCTPAGCFDFTIFDSFGDGICCTWGTGSYTVTDLSGVGAGTVVASGGSFAASQTTSINCVVLPVEFGDFEVFAHETNVDILWTTNSERESDYFEVERSLDLDTWEVVDVVKGAGNSIEERSYESVDNDPFKGVNYYRIKQVDFDGKVTYTEVKNAFFGMNSALSVSPNPFNTSFSINILSDYHQDATIVLQDLNGNITSRSMVTVGEGLSKIPFGTEHLRKGVYVVTVYMNGTQYNERVVKL
jgi:hypothetical protein